MEYHSDKKNLFEILFDPEISDILNELENGEKELSFLSEKLQISGNKILDKLDFLIKEKFVELFDENGKKTLSANADKLSKALEDEKNFQNVVEGLTEMDSYLN